MNRLAITFLALVVAAPAAFADEAPEKEAPPAGDLQEIHRAVDEYLDRIGIRFYGHMKLDMSRDSAETNFGNTAFFVKNYGDGDKDEEINITARHTRLGMDWTGGEFEGVKAFAKIEIDFLGKSVQKNTETQELQGALRMRHAWMRFDWGGGWSLLAGQTWDVFGRPFMKKLNTLVGWGQGNVAFRRPQLILSKSSKVGDGGKLTGRFSIARPVARDKGFDDDTQDDGEDRGVPDLQAFLGYRFPVTEKKSASVGVGGFYGWREVGGGGSKLMDDENYESWLIVLDATVPVCDCVELMGELWRGQSLDGYRGGVWQSYVVDDGELNEIEAWGGWLSVVWKPAKRWMVVAGYGVDDPKNDDFRGQDGKYDNKTLFGNVRYAFWKKATVGFEVDQMRTDYRDDKSRTNYRFQVSFRLPF